MLAVAIIGGLLAVPILPRNLAALDGRFPVLYT